MQKTHYDDPYNSFSSREQKSFYAEFYDSDDRVNFVPLSHKLILYRTNCVVKIFNFYVQENLVVCVMFLKLIEITVQLICVQCYLF